MHDADIAKICLLIAVVGVAALFLITEMIQPRDVHIGNIDSSFVGSSVRLAATVKSVSSKDGNVFMNLYDGNSIDAVMFERDARKYPDIYALQKNDNITVIGDVDIYQSELEIVVKSIGTVG